jgi:hypothetical protein
MEGDSKLAVFLPVIMLFFIRVTDFDQTLNFVLEITKSLGFNL